MLNEIYKGWKYMNINECSKLTKCSKATLRYYDKKSIVTPSRDINGYRDYSKEMLKKLGLFKL
ncbi:MerR family transcriptional regulator [Xylocopilactobacillus apicola]